MGPISFLGLSAKNRVVAGDSSPPSLCENTELAELNEELTILEQLALVDQAMTECPDNSAYLMALQTCPKLIEKESNPLTFWLFSEKCPHQTAKRLTEYWKLRLEVFGPDRCYRPLYNDYSGNGALSQPVIDILQKHDAGCLLPVDQQNRMVVNFNCSGNAKYNEELGITLERTLQIVFHLLQLVSQVGNRTFQGTTRYTPPEFVVIHIVRTKNYTISPGAAHFLSRAIQDCFPICCLGYRSVYAPDPLSARKKHMFLRKSLPFVQQVMKGAFGTFKERSVEFVETKTTSNKRTIKFHKQAAMDLRLALTSGDIGLRESGLPRYAGGPWSFERMKKALDGNDMQCYCAARPESYVSPSVSPLEVLATAATIALDAKH